MKLNKKSIGIIILLIAVIGGGFWYFSKEQRTASKEQSGIVEQQEVVKQDKEGLNNQTEDKTEELKIEDIDTSNWKTYRNEEFGFEVKYPEGWETKYIDEYNKDWDMKINYLSVFKKDNPQKLTLYVWKKGSSFSTGRSGVSAGNFVPQKDVLISGMKVKINNLVQDSIVKEIFFNGENDKYEIGGFFSCIENSEITSSCIKKDEINIFRNILSTLEIK